MPVTHLDFRPLSVLVGAAFFMEQLDATIISPVIPDIAKDFGVAPLSLSLTMTLYLLCSLVFIPISGLLASKFGTRKVFCWSVTIFVVSSVLCALSTNLLELALARSLQGASAALMVPVGRTALVNSVAKGHLVQALAWMITPAMLGPMLGPPLGGLMSAYLTWHWVFLINVPVGIAGLLAARHFMPQMRDTVDTRFDPVEWLLASVSLALLIGWIECLRHMPNGAISWLMALPFVISVAAYIGRFRHLESPLLDFRLLRLSTFSAGFWGGALVRVGYGALPFLLPLMLQLGLGYSALQSGLVLLAGGAVSLLTKTRTAAMLRRWGFRRLLVWNGSLCAACLAACALFPWLPWGLLPVILVVSLAGFFRAVQFNALTAIAYADMPARKVAAATTLNTMAWQLAIMLGIALSTLIVSFSASVRGQFTPASFDYAVAFVILAVVAAAAWPCYRALSPRAGEELSGHRVSSA